jgi:hypothetical protein
MPINALNLLARLDAERRSLARTGEDLDQLPHISRLASADGSRHSIIFSSIDHQNADRIIEEEIAHYGKLDAEVEWKVYSHDSPPDLTTRLERHGFVIGERESVLVLDLLEKHEWIDAPCPYRVESVKSLEQVEQYQRAAENILQKDYSFTASELSLGIRNASTEHVGYLCFEGPIPVSIGRLYTHPRSAFGGLYGGATLKANRGKGCYRCLTARRGRDARAMGVRYLMVDALPTSRPILIRLGFVEVAQTWPCILERQK